MLAVWTASPSTSQASTTASPPAPGTAPATAPGTRSRIYLGQLADRRWYVHTTQRAVVPDAWAWPTRDRAEEQVAELLAQRSDWTDAPAWFDNRGQPHGELGPWKKVGRRWVLDV